MPQLADLSRYLKSAAVDNPRGAGRGPLHPFVTISRQTGAGGRSLADTLLKTMEEDRRDPLFSDWRVYDRELCERVASSGELQVSLKSLLSEEFLSDMEDYLRQILAGQSPQVLVRREIFSTIRSLAMTGKAVILGRGGACLTSSLGKGVHIRLVASRESRIQRLRDRFSLSESEALEQADKQDAHREKLVRVCFGKDIENPLLYDAVYNTDTVPFAVIASAVMGMVKERELQPVY